MAAEEFTSADLLRRHEELQVLYGDGDSGNFLSGWQCENPWAQAIEEQIALARMTVDGSRYHYLENESPLREGFSALHSDMDHCSPEALFFGEGATSIIFTFAAWLKERDFNEVYYVPPLYFTFHYALRLFGIRARPVAARHPFENEFVWNLPPEKGVLLVCDPIWYAGIPLHESLVETLARWQRRSGSAVFVDGSFQYMRWSGKVQEPTSKLDPSATMRLICPTKMLAIHGYRFAYATIPKSWQISLGTIYSNIYGSATSDNIAFARAAIRMLHDRTITRGLMRLAAHRHLILRDRGTIRSAWHAQCGYFVFEQITAPLLQDPPLMDGSFFEQRRYPDHRRVNLLSPSVRLLGEDLDLGALVKFDQDTAVPSDGLSDAS